MSKGTLKNDQRDNKFIGNVQRHMRENTQYSHFLKYERWFSECRLKHFVFKF